MIIHPIDEKSITAAFAKAPRVSLEDDAHEEFLAALKEIGIFETAVTKRLEVYVGRSYKGGLMVRFHHHQAAHGHVGLCLVFRCKRADVQALEKSCILDAYSLKAVGELAGVANQEADARGPLPDEGPCCVYVTWRVVG